MLLNDFYTITSQKTEEGKTESSISLNVNHPIYKGHFPQQPVVPGVCMLQMIAELVGQALKIEGLKIKEAKQAKFLVPIIPNKNTNLLVETTASFTKGGDITVKGNIKNEEHIFFKFKGTLNK